MSISGRFDHIIQEAGRTAERPAREDPAQRAAPLLRRRARRVQRPLSRCGGDPLPARRVGRSAGNPVRRDAQLRQHSPRHRQAVRRPRRRRRLRRQPVAHHRPLPPRRGRQRRTWRLLGGREVEARATGAGGHAVSDQRTLPLPPSPLSAEAHPSLHDVRMGFLASVVAASQLRPRLLPRGGLPSAEAGPTRVMEHRRARPPRRPLIRGECVLWCLRFLPAMRSS